MNGYDEQALKILIENSKSILLTELKKQLQKDMDNGLVSSTLSATKITREHVENFINGKSIDWLSISKLCRYYYGIGGEIIYGCWARNYTD